MISLPALTLLLFAPVSREGRVQTGDVAELRLENGLEILIERVPGSKAMGLFLFVKGGYAEDPPERSGLAHLLEHMVMTAATPGREAWTYERWVRERKLGANAMTRPRWTVYWSIGTREELGADARRLGEILAGKAEFRGLERERQRCKDEARNMTERSPGGILMWRARAVMRAGEPEGRQGIGIPKELARMGQGELRALYRRSHRPGRALLVVVGQVDPVLDEPFYREVFGPIPAGEEAEQGPRSGPGGSREPGARVSRHARVGGVFGTYAFRAPEPWEEDYASFVLAAYWLCQRASIGFRFRGNEGYASFFPGLYPMIEGGHDLVFLNRRGEDGQTLESLREELATWIRQNAGAKVLPASLVFQRRQIESLLDPLPRSKTRARLLAARPRLLYRLGLARGGCRLAGFPKKLWQSVQATTAKQVEQALRKHFSPEQGTFVALVPPE